MTEPSHFERLIVVFEGGRREAVRDVPALVGLASSLDARLDALFVKGRDLTRCAALPFTRQVGISSASLHPFSAHDLECQLRRQADHLRDAIDHHARREGVALSFEFAAWEAADPIVPRNGDKAMVVRRTPRGPGAEITADALLGTAAAALLLTGPLRGPVLALVDDHAESARAVDLARRLAKRMQSHCRVVAVRADSDPAPDSGAEALSPDAVLGHLRTQRVGLVVGSALVLADTIGELLEERLASVLMLR